MAFLCDRIQTSGDGDELVIHRVRSSIVQPGDRRAGEYIAFELRFLLVVWPGEVRGPHDLLLRAVTPSGDTRHVLHHHAEFGAVDQPVMWTAAVRSTPAEVGLWWFDVLLDDEAAPPLTRVPLLVLPQGA